MRKCLVTLSDETAQALDNEPNKSALVDALLHRHYDLPINGDSPVALSRAEALKQVGVVTDPEFTGSVLSDEEEIPTIAEIREELKTELPPLDLPVKVDIEELRVRVMGEPKPEPVIETETAEVEVGSTICPKCGRPFIPPTCLSCL